MAYQTVSNQYPVVYVPLPSIEEAADLNAGLLVAIVDAPKVVEG